MFGSNKRATVGRHVARWWHQILMAHMAAICVVICARLPGLTAALIQRQPNSAVEALSLSSSFLLREPLEWAYLACLVLAYQLALLGLRTPRLKLTRPLFGAVASVTLTTCLACLGLGFGTGPTWIPLGLGALWISGTYGVGAGLIALVAIHGVVGAAGFPHIFEPSVVVRAVVLILTFRAIRSGAAIWVAGLASGAAAAAAQLLISEVGNLGAMGILRHAMPLVAGGSIEALALWITASIGQKVLGQVSREKLVALLDLSQPLLERMMKLAPGSFEHSRAMANLAEQAASSIGADALLTRVGAYYHDLGKSVEPKFFVENLLEGETSAHDGLTPLESVRHIVRHVTDGVQILRSAGIPEPIVEFSYTHHGSQYVEYFLNQQRKLYPDKEPDFSAFAYPGMKPSTKETAILMLVDSIEAASRTIDSRDRDKIKEMVWRIIFSKLAAGQLDESGLSMSELRIMSARVVDTLVHMNHHRIKYPWQEDRSSRGQQLSETRVQSKRTTGGLTQIRGVV